jgi:integrase
MAQGFARRTAKDARTTLTTILNDAIPRHIKVNPAARRRGKGRKGQRRIEHHEQAEKVWATPLQVLLIAERLAALTGRDEDFLLGITDGYTGMRWSETVGLAPDYVLPDYTDGDALDIQWKLYEFGGHFYRGRPKDGSIRPADLPPFLADLLTWHKTQIKGRRCTCRKFDEATGPAPGTTWCMGGEYMFLSPGGSHYRRGPYGERYFHPAADGWYPERSHRSARPVLIDPSAPFPGQPLAAWPAAAPGEEFVPPTGRGVARFVSDPAIARCAVCRRAFPRRRDGLVISHQNNGDRCPGSGQVPGEDLAVASWAPIIEGLTPHGKRHGHKVWMDEDQIADVLKSERLGHDEPGMRGVYGHVSPAMREELKAALQARWEESLRQRAALSPVSAVPVLNRLLAGVRPINKAVRSRLAPKIGHRTR